MSPTGILEPPDQKLFKLAKTWVGIFIPQARAMIPKGYLGRWEMYKALVKIGYEVVGKKFILVFMRRGSTVISVFIGSPSLFEGFINKDEVEMLEKIKELSSVEEWKLTGDGPFVKIYLGRDVSVEFYKREKVELGTVENYNLSLNSIELRAGENDGFLRLNIDVMNEIIHRLHITYCLEDNGWVRRELTESVMKRGWFYSYWKFQPHLSRGMMEIIDPVLRIVNEKATVFDELLSQAGQLVIEALR
jgi:hypothetical protein